MIKLFTPSKKSSWRPGYIRFLGPYAQHPQGLTDREVAAQLGVSDNHARRARLSLVEAGYLEDSGQVRPQPGRKASGIYRITFQGLNQIQGATA